MVVAGRVSDLNLLLSSIKALLTREQTPLPPPYPASGLIMRSINGSRSLVSAKSLCARLFNTGWKGGYLKNADCHFSPH